MSLALEGWIPVIAYVPSKYGIILDPIHTGETRQKDIIPGGLKELTLRECYGQALTEVLRIALTFSCVLTYITTYGTFSRDC